MLSILFALLFSQTSFAQDKAPNSFANWGMDGFQTQQTRVFIGLIGESWGDAFIGQVYRPSANFGNVALQYRFHTHFLAGIESGLIRVKGNRNKTALQLIPVVMNVNVLFGNDYVEPFIGLGFSFVHFLESAPSGSVAGTKVGTEVRAGVRIATNFIKPPQHPNQQLGAKQMDIELMFAQRLHQMFGVGAGQGFNMSASRFGVGAIFKF
ncbi:MAG: hypothetical protein VX278_07290 [Myxococcota bacterium]|nr:hypothetical protein [Myxococcota bacterium]